MILSSLAGCCSPPPPLPPPPLRILPPGAPPSGPDSAFARALAVAVEAPGGVLVPSASWRSILLEHSQRLAYVEALEEGYERQGGEE
ncbi:MAG: hypothetical protein KDD82_28690 [Planctomycetes bacterium]|nr:hypothetical protein [Planctomycetota bacterium]